MRFARGGMSLFELLVVMVIVGIVYSLVVFSIRTEKATVSEVPLDALKKTLEALDYDGKLRLFCDSGCEECRLYRDDAPSSSSFRLKTGHSIQRYGFNRFGDLEPLEPVVSDNHQHMEPGCFEYTLYPDGSSSFLLLKSADTYYLYTPLGGEKPFMTQSEERLKEALFSTSLYPLTRDDYARD